MAMTRSSIPTQKAVWVAIGGAFVAGTLWLLGRTLLLLFASILLAILLRSLAGWASRWLRISHGWGLVAVFTVLALLASAAGYAMAPEVVRQSAELVRDLQLAVSQINRTLSSELPHSGLSIGALPSASTLTLQILGVTTSVTGVLVAAAIILFVGFYGAVDPKRYVGGFVRLMPPSSRQRAQEVLDAITHTLRWWLVGRTVTMASVGLITFAGLTLVGIPLAIALSLLAGLLTFIPYLGAIISGVPAVLIAAIHAPSLIPQVILVYAVAYTCEGYLIAPLVQQRAAQLSPAIMLAAQAILGTLFGIAGVAFAAPLAAASMVLTRMIYVQDILGDRTTEGTNSDRSTP